MHSAARRANQQATTYPLKKQSNKISDISFFFFNWPLNTELKYFRYELDFAWLFEF